MDGVLIASLVEYYVSEDRDDIEMGRMFKNALTQFDYEGLAKQTGIKRGTIFNFVNLLKLPQDLQDKVRRKEVTLRSVRNYKQPEKRVVKQTPVEKPTNSQVLDAATRLLAHLMLWTPDDSIDSKRVFSILRIIERHMDS